MLDIVEQLMRVHDVHMGVDLRVRAGKPPSGTVIMHHQVVEPQNARIAHNFLRNGMHQRFVRRLAEQGIDRVPRNADT